MSQSEQSDTSGHLLIALAWVFAGVVVYLTYDPVIKKDGLEKSGTPAVAAPSEFSELFDTVKINMEDGTIFELKILKSEGINIQEEMEKDYVKNSDGSWTPRKAYEKVGIDFEDFLEKDK